MPAEDMEREGVVRDLVVEHNGQTYKAVFFVERGEIHIKTGHRLYRIPKADLPSEEAVRNLLIGLATDMERKRGQVAYWSERLPDRNPDEAD